MAMTEVESLGSRLVLFARKKTVELKFYLNQGRKE